MLLIASDDQRVLPTRVALNAEVTKAKADCKSIFKRLPTSVERTQPYDALARLGQRSLRRKIEHRASLITRASGRRFEGLADLVAEAVTCRNHFVHGSLGTLDYVENFEAVVFLCETLEFIFGCSDLIDAGWDMKGWLASNPQPGHPFGSYVHAYQHGRSNVQALQADAQSKAQT